jgi:hypothetical protein
VIYLYWWASTFSEGEGIHALSGIRTHDPSVRASEDSSCLRPRGYCDRRTSAVWVSVTTIDRRTCFGMYAFPVSLEYFTGFAGAGHPVGGCNRYGLFQPSLSYADAPSTHFSRLNATLFTTYNAHYILRIPASPKQS